MTNSDLGQAEDSDAAEAGGKDEADMKWQIISTHPKDEMFIWGYRNSNKKWAIGLAYQNVSGGWSDAYGQPTMATHWYPLPEPPENDLE